MKWKKKEKKEVKDNGIWMKLKKKDKREIKER